MGKLLKNSTHLTNLLIIFFLLIVIGDALTKIFFHAGTYNPSKYIKAFLIIPLVLLSYKNEKNVFIYLSISFLLFFIGSIYISINRFYSNIPQFFEYYFLVLFFIAFRNVKYEKIGALLKVVFLLHALIIVLATIFDFHFLKTYSYSKRLGYLSLFNSQNEFSYVMMAGIMYFTVMAKRENILSILELLFIITAGLLVGTKAILLFIFIFGLYYLFFKTRPKFYLPLIAVIISIIVIFRNSIISFLKQNYNTLYVLYKKEGFVSFLSSKRSVFIEERLKSNNEEFDFLNYLFGSYDLANLYEMSLFDVFYFFGTIGALLYGYILYKFVIKKVYFNKILLIFTILVGSITIVAGYFIENASAQIYVLLTILVLGAYFRSNSFDVDKNTENIKAK